MSTIEVRDAPDEGRYLVTVDGEDAGGAYYTIDAGRVRFTHTEVKPQFEGKGVASTLARKALDDVRATRRTAIPQCPYIAKYIRRHQEYLDVVDERHRRSVTAA